MYLTIEIAKENSDWKECKGINKSLMKKILKVILSRFQYFSQLKEVELSILLSCDNTMQDLNAKFRGKKKPTNVLSFPDTELNPQGLLEFKPDLNYIYLGDIAFSYQTIKNEAISQRKSFHNHFIHLFVHSVLHLIGFDHENEKEAIVMEDLEVEILKGFAIKNVY